MPKLFVFDTQRRVTTNFTIAFARGVVNYNNQNQGPWEIKHLPITNYLQNGLPNDLVPGRDAVATLGILRGTGLMLKEARSKGIDYYYMDHAYFKPGYSGKGWMRITKNGHACTILRDCTSERWKGFHKNAGYEKQAWRTNNERGPLIVVCPPTHAVSWFFDLKPEQWENKIVETLKKYLPENEHNRIVVRRKPREPIVDKVGNLVKLHEYQQEGTLAEALDQAHCVIAYNSMVALEATLRGIPVITSEHSCCNRVSFSLEDFNNNPMPEKFNSEPVNRTVLLHWLACNQWKMREIESGKAWGMLQENYLGF